MRRRIEPELLDRPGHDLETLAGNLRDIERLNRWFGGYHLTVRALESLLHHDGVPHTLSVLDVGAGAAGVAPVIGRWVAQRGGLARIAALDLSWQIVDLARTQFDRTTSPTDSSRQQEPPRFVVGDVRALPFENRAFDVAISSLLLHHLEPDDAVRALQEMRRVARVGVIVNDLVRSLPSYCGAWLVSRLLSSNPLTRNDAPLSVRRAYTRRELEWLAASAGLRTTALLEFGGIRIALVAGIAR